MREGYCASVMTRISLCPAVLMTWCGRWKASHWWHVFTFILERIQLRDIYALLWLSVLVLDFTLCNAHSPLNCLERNIKWSSCVSAACNLKNLSRHFQTSVKTRQSLNVIKPKTNQVLFNTKIDHELKTSLKGIKRIVCFVYDLICFFAKC